MIVEFLNHGGPLVYPLIACSIISLGLILERAVFWLAEARRNYANDLERYIALVRTQGANAALEFARSSKSPLLSRLESQMGDIERFLALVDFEIQLAEDKGYRYLRGLDTVVAVAPLLGILGTVLGIVESFSVLNFSGLVNREAVGAGLAQALLTTVAGLAIAVPTLICANIFSSIADGNLARLERFRQTVAMVVESGSLR